jgi:nucleoside-diphosphate-sugar epimerase
MKIAVTGAQGFIGSALCQALSLLGHEVSCWVRSPKKPGDKVFVMPDKIEPALFEDKPDWVIHAAYVTQFKTAKKTWAANIKGSMRLFELAQDHGSKILFLSSLSAHVEALSIYGRSKFQLESALDLNKHLIVKPGIVIGPGGLFLRMIRLLQRLWFGVLFWGGTQPLYGVALDDLIAACIQLMEQNAVGRYHVMEAKPHTVKNFYQTLMQALELKPRMLSLPGDISLFAVQQLEKMRIHLPISSENLLGLKQACLFESDLEKIGVSSMSLNQAVAQTLLKLKYSDNKRIQG